MPRRKQSRPSPSQKGHGSNNRFANRYSHANPATPTNGRRGKAQRLLLLGDDFDLDPYDGPGSSSGNLGRHHNLTLQQEARNTEERSFRRNDDRKLRQLGITFVRPQQTDDLAGETSTVPPAAVSGQTCETTYAPPPLPLETTPKGSELTATDTPPFRQADSPQVGLLPQNDRGSHLQTQNESSSSEEEVVFVPRNQRRPDGAQSKSQSKAQHPALSETYPTATSPPRKSKPPKKPPRNFRRSNDEDEILADYIRNLKENGEDVGGVFSLRPLGSHLDDIDTGNESSHRQEARPSSYDLGCNEAEVYLDVAVAAIIGKRSGEFGTEYHFKPAGSTVDEALWLEGTDMTRDIQHLIDHFEAGLDDTEDFSSVLEDSDLRISDDQGDLDQELAKILQLEGRDEEEEDDDFDFDPEDLMNMMLGKPNKQGKFPRASKLADAYDDFDITSRERASLSRPFNRKSRKADIGRFPNKPVNLDMDDDEAELHIELERYILQDREKKKIRKQEREVRRQSGMLGNSSTPTKSASMDIKSYPGGTSLSKVHTSIKQFLMSGFAERLSLPPMHKQDRLQVHILAHKFFMESKSQGKGNGRFPVLYKTTQTRLFEGDEEAIEIVLSRPGGRGLRGVFGNSRSKAGRQLNSGGGGRINSNKEGMIVGTGAAELGQGNKGYDMLSKMGWTTGTGLGSNRSGILDPVQAIVKNSRAGLG